MGIGGPEVIGGRVGKGADVIGGPGGPEGIGGRVGIGADVIGGPGGPEEPAGEITAVVGGSDGAIGVENGVSFMDMDIEKDMESSRVARWTSKISFKLQSG